MLWAIAAKAPADDQTLLFGASFYRQVYAPPDGRLPYDPVKDFVPISLVTKVPNVMVARHELSVWTVSEFIAHAKANPGKLYYASSGNVPAQSPHLSSGKIHVLAVTSARRNFRLPDVPTMADASVPGFEITVW
jgi:tripartite-type tricarboxylate transporter receptor subunit TctC